MADNELINEMTRVGKKVSITIEITDSDIASKLLGTMYGKHKELFGVEVVSWGYCDLISAEEERIKKVDQIVSIFSDEMADLINKRPHELLGIDLG